MVSLLTLLLFRNFVKHSDTEVNLTSLSPVKSKQANVFAVIDGTDIKA